MANWVKKDNDILTLSLQKMLVKLIAFNPELIKPIFSKLETSWLYATQNMIKLNTNFLKATYKIDPEFYFSVYENYKNTRNPVFADILCNAICCCNDTLQQTCDHWAMSGNIKLKKIGIHGQKVLKKKLNNSTRKAKGYNKKYGKLHNQRGNAAVENPHE